MMHKDLMYNCTTIKCAGYRKYLIAKKYPYKSRHYL